MASARRAFPAWADTPVPDRAQVMFRFKQLLEDRFDFVFGEDGDDGGDQHAHGNAVVCKHAHGSELGGRR